jgi:hypothetical protein
MTFAGIGSLEMRIFCTPSTLPTRSRVATSELSSLLIRRTTTAVVRSPFSPRLFGTQRIVGTEPSLGKRVCVSCPIKNGVKVVAMKITIFEFNI